MNNESKKLTWAVGLVAGLGVLSIAYAALSSTLNIKGENASVNVGYVRFQGGEDGDSEFTVDQKGSQPWAIGSTNKEYIKGNVENGTASGGIFEREDGSTGLILKADNFSKNWAKALAKPGNLKLSETNKVKDTVTITNAELNDYGSFIIYKLDIINEAANDMRLKNLPSISLDRVTSTNGGESAADTNIERAIYTDCDTTNFVKPCTTPLKITTKGSDGTIEESSKTDFNYLTPGKKTTWYLRVGFKNYNETSNNLNGKVTFDFSVIPQWEAVMS